MHRTGKRWTVTHHEPDLAPDKRHGDVGVHRAPHYRPRIPVHSCRNVERHYGRGMLIHRAHCLSEVAADIALQAAAQQRIDQ